MNLTQSGQVLLNVCSLVDSELASRPLKFPGSSPYAMEISSIQDSGRREFLESYLSESLMSLFLGVLDQARSIALISDTPPAAVSPLILMRTLTEYNYKIVYLANEAIDTDERIRRTLQLYYVDLAEYKKLPEAIRPQGSTTSLKESIAKVKAWYRELTGANLTKTSAKAIMDAVWKSGLEYMEENSSTSNDAYEIGYRVGSALAHGNVWAIQNHCLIITGEQEGLGVGLEIRPSLLFSLHLLAAATVLISLAFVLEYASAVPDETMNKIKEMMRDLTAAGQSTQPEEN